MSIIAITATILKERVQIRKSMEAQQDDGDPNPYSSLIQELEQLHSCFKMDNNYSAIKQQLTHCWQEMDLHITLETDHTSFLALCQQKHLLTFLITIMERLEKEDAKHQHVAATKRELPSPGKYHNTDWQLLQSGNKKETNTAVLANIAEVPKVSGLNDIIGLREIKKVLKSLVILPKSQPQLFYNRRACNSILLYGPPGTGKTRLTHALAAEANAKFHCLSASDILSQYVGQTERTVKNLFQCLKTNCEFTILFIDEIDAFCRKRSENEQEYTRRLKTEIMCQMSSIEDCKNVIIMCATNCPWDLDSAILRRLQKRIYVPLPDQIEREEFFRVMTNNSNFENFDEWTLLAQKTVGYSGSDLFDVVQSAMTIPLNELEDNIIWKCCDDGYYEPVLGEQDFSNVICSVLSDLPANSVRARKVRLQDLILAVDTVRSTVTQSDIKQYERFNRA